eukprot:403372714
MFLQQITPFGTPSLITTPAGNTIAQRNYNSRLNQTSQNLPLRLRDSYSIPSQKLRSASPDEILLSHPRYQQMVDQVKDLRKRLTTSDTENSILKKQLNDNDIQIQLQRKEIVKGFDYVLFNFDNLLATNHEDEETRAVIKLQLYKLAINKAILFLQRQARNIAKPQTSLDLQDRPKQGKREEISDFLDQSLFMNITQDIIPNKSSVVRRNSSFVNTSAINTIKMFASQTQRLKKQQQNNYQDQKSLEKIGKECYFAVKDMQIKLEERYIPVKMIKIRDLVYEIVQSSQFNVDQPQKSKQLKFGLSGSELVVRQGGGYVNLWNIQIDIV